MMDIIETIIYVLVMAVFGVFLLVAFPVIILIWLAAELNEKPERYPYK